MTAESAPAARRGALAVALWLAAVAAALVVAWRTPLRRRPVGVPARRRRRPSRRCCSTSCRAARPRACSSSASKAARRRRGGAAARAEASKRVAARCARAARSRRSHNGENAAWADAGRFLFEHRYLLSPAVDAARFTAAGLRDGDRRDASRCSARRPARCSSRSCLRDPTGETRAHRRGADAGACAADRGRRLGLAPARRARVLLATTRADGADLDAPAARPRRHPQRLRRRTPTPGLQPRRSRAPACSRVDVARAHQERGRAPRDRSAADRDRRCCWLAFALAARARRRRCCRSRPACVAGIAAVSLGFGQVHGMTLGFGTTLIGEAVDYAIYYLIQARGGDGAAERWRARQLADGAPRPPHVADRLRRARLLRAFPAWRSSACSRSPAWSPPRSTTRFVFPVLVPDGAPGAGLRRQLGRLMSAAARGCRGARLGVVAARVASARSRLVALPSPWRGELSSLSPVSAADLALDATLRADVGAPDAGTLVAVAGAGRGRRARRRRSRRRRASTRLVAAGVARRATTRRRACCRARRRSARRLAALPDAATLRDAARRSDRRRRRCRRRGSRRFIADVQAARTAAAVRSRRARRHAARRRGRRAAAAAATRRRPGAPSLNLQAGADGRPRRRPRARRDRRRAGRARRRDQARARRALRALPARGRVAGGARRGRRVRAARAAPALRRAASPRSPLPIAAAIAGRPRRAGGVAARRSASCTSSACC